MEFVCVVDKGSADKLKSLGFRCQERDICGSDVYMFVETEELRHHLENGVIPNTRFFEKRYIDFGRRHNNWKEK
jgi:hypothetical protein